jgi:Sulfite exporter TauE/SafE
MRAILFLVVLPSSVGLEVSDAQNTLASTRAVSDVRHPQGTIAAPSTTWRGQARISQNSAGFVGMEEPADRNVFETKVNDNNRDLRSGGSNSRDSRDGDDFWRNPDYWDDYVGHNRDDDFYKYIGDPLPPKLSPIQRRDVIGFMFASLGATLGSIGGIGAGGFVVPCYIIVSGLAPRFAMPLGAVTVLGGSLAALVLNLRRRHPLADRPIIDWDLILVMEPLVLVGTLIGSILHRVVSEKILTVLLVLLLSIVAHTTLAKAKRMYDAERRYIEHLKTARSDYLSRVASFRTAFRMSEAGWSADALPGMDPGSKTAASSYYMPPSPVRTTSIDSRSTAPISPRMDVYERERILILNPDFVTLRSDLLEQEKVTPRSKVLVLVAKFSVLMFLNISLGGGAFPSPWGIECGGVAFWVVHVIMIAFLLSSAWAAQVSFRSPHFLGGERLAPLIHPLQQSRIHSHCSSPLLPSHSNCSSLPLDRRLIW